MNDYSKYIDLITDWSIKFVPKLILAIIILIVGFWIVKKLNKVISMALNKAALGPEITGFMSSIFDIILKFVVILIAASVVGFEVSSLLGILAAAAFAIGLALQGFMGNFASGITIVFFKPYKVGDWVEIADKFGKVKGIQIFSTILETPGQKTLIVPNGQVTDNVVTNFSTKGQIRLKLEVTMPYGESFPRVKKIINEALADFDKIINDPEPEIGIITYDTHYIVIAVRPYIRPDNFWEATYGCNERIKNAFNKHGVQMSYSEGIELGEIGE